MLAASDPPPAVEPCVTEVSSVVEAVPSASALLDCEDVVLEEGTLPSVLADCSVLPSAGPPNSVVLDL